MTYSCAVFDTPDHERSTEAQANKHELICQKLRAASRGRGCSTSAAVGARCCSTPRQHHGVRGVGDHDLAASSTSWRPSASPRPGSAGQIEIRLQDYRDIDDGPFDAIISIGMFEHVGPGQDARLQPQDVRPAAARRTVPRTTASAGRPTPSRGSAIGRSGPASSGRRPRSGHRGSPDQEPVHRAVRVPRRRAARGRHDRDADGRGGLRGPPRREPAGALRADAAELGAEPRGQLGRGGRGRRRGPGPGVAAVHGRVRGGLRAPGHRDPPGAGGEARRRTGRSSRSGPPTDGSQDAAPPTPNPESPVLSGRTVAMATVPPETRSFGVVDRSGGESEGRDLERTEAHAERPLVDDLESGPGLRRWVVLEEVGEPSREVGAANKTNHRSNARVASARPP